MRHMLILFAALVILTTSACTNVENNPPNVRVNHHDEAAGPPDEWKGFLSGELLWGFKSPNGEVIIEPQFTNATSFTNGVLAVEFNHSDWYLINAAGKIISHRPYKSISRFTEGFAVFGIEIDKNMKYGFVNLEGEEVIPPKFSGEPVPFRNGVSCISTAEKGIYIDNLGNTLASFLRARPFREGFAAVKPNKKSKWGFIDENFMIVIPAEYDDVSSFDEGLAAISVDNKIGYIDTKGAIAIAPVYKTGFDFREGFAAVENTKGWFLINKEGIRRTPIYAEKTFLDRISYGRTDNFGTFYGELHGWKILVTAQKNEGIEPTSSDTPPGQFY